MSTAESKLRHRRLGTGIHDMMLLRQCEAQMMVLNDTAFHAAEGDPTNLKLCPRGAWEDRMLVETVLSMLTLVCYLKKVMHRVWVSAAT